MPGPSRRRRKAFAPELRPVAAIDTARTMRETVLEARLLRDPTPEPLEDDARRIGRVPMPFPQTKTILLSAQSVTQPALQGEVVAPYRLDSQDTPKPVQMLAELPRETVQLPAQPLGIADMVEQSRPQPKRGLAALRPENFRQRRQPVGKRLGAVRQTLQGAAARELRAATQSSRILGAHLVQARGQAFRVVPPCGKRSHTM